MIVGIGVDLVDVARFEHRLATTPRLLPRLFAESEQTKGGRPMPLRSLAGRFAAKEALVKALGDSGGVPWRWRDLRVVSERLGQPRVRARRGPAGRSPTLRASARSICR